MNVILIAVISLGVIALVSAAILYVASKKFAVYEDPRIAQVAEVLPQANCGGCGYPGCSGFADACVKAGSLDGKLCPVGGQPVMTKIAEILGLDAAAAEPMVAVVRCNGTCANRPRVNQYDGAKSCAIAASLYGGETGCSYGCLGCGDCVAACQFDAIHMNPETGLPEVDEEKCTACGACAKACPKSIIEIRPQGKKSRRIYVQCVNKDKGAVARKACTVACIGCGKCVKVCPFEAITLENNLAYIDPNKCKSCRKCEEACPQNTIIALNFPPRKPKADDTAPQVKVAVPKAEVEKIAEPGGFVSAAIHSSVSGKVAKIDTIVDASGYAKPAIFIDVEGDEWEESIDRSETLVKECSLTSEEIVKKIADAGIVGLGGACFPTQVKLCPPPAFKAECVIINAVECEPYLTADHQLMLEHAEEIMVGVSILMKAVKVNKAFIGIENNKPDAIQLMTKVASSYAGIEVVPLKVQYPQGGEKQLIDAVISRQVAAGALPISTGAVVQNVGTAFAVYQAVQKNKPLFERVITVTGKSLAKPSNFLARIGTPMKQLIEACGGLPEDTGKIIGGGPMMGKALVNTDVPTAKGSSGILIMNEKEAKRGEVQPCIRCAKCVGACPMGLEPYLLATVSAHGDFERVEKEDIMSCIECGSCQFTCPSNRPMLDYIRLGKGKVGAMIRARQAKK